MAGSVSSRASLTVDLGWSGPRIESQLPGAAPYSNCRPVPDDGDRPLRVPGFRHEQLRPMRCGSTPLAIAASAGRPQLLRGTAAVGYRPAADRARAAGLAQA